MAMTMAAGMAKKAEGEMVRAAFDVGSGATKMSVALVRVAANDKVSSDGGDGGGKDLGDATVEVKQILFEVREECLLRGDLEEQRAMGNGANLSQAALDHCFHILQRFKHSAAREHGATHFAGVATAVFREATNGKEFFSRVKTELGINVCIIPQTVSACARTSSHRQLCCILFLCAKTNVALSPMLDVFGIMCILCIV